jgi:hypothetical protein
MELETILIKADCCLKCFKPLISEQKNCDECNAPALELFESSDQLPLQFFSHFTNRIGSISLKKILGENLSRSEIFSRLFDVPDFLAKVHWDMADVPEAYRRLVALSKPSAYDDLIGEKEISLTRDDGSTSKLQSVEVEIKKLLCEILFPPIRSAIEEAKRQTSFLKREIELVEPHLLTKVNFEKVAEKELLQLAMDLLLFPAFGQRLADYKKVNVPENEKSKFPLRTLSEFGFLPVAKDLAELLTCLVEQYDSVVFNQLAEAAGLKSKDAYFTVRPFRDALFIETLSQFVSWRTFQQDPFSATPKPIRYQLELTCAWRTLLILKDQLDLRPWALIAGRALEMKLSAEETTDFDATVKSEDLDLRATALLSLDLITEEDLKGLISLNKKFSSLSWLLSDAAAPEIEWRDLENEKLSDSDLAAVYERLDEIETKIANFQAPKFSQVAIQNLVRHFGTTKAPGKPSLLAQRMGKSEIKNEEFEKTRDKALGILLYYVPNAAEIAGSYPNKIQSYSFNSFWLREVIELNENWISQLSKREDAVSAIEIFLCSMPMSADDLKKYLKSISISAEAVRELHAFCVKQPHLVSSLARLWWLSRESALALKSEDISHMMWLRVFDFSDITLLVDAHNRIECVVSLFTQTPLTEKHWQTQTIWMPGFAQYLRTISNWDSDSHEFFNKLIFSADFTTKLTAENKILLAETATTRLTDDNSLYDDAKMLLNGLIEKFGRK